MLEVYNAMTLNAYAGLTMQEFNLVIGRPKQQIEEEQDGVPITKLVMDRVTFTFVEGVLQSWEFTNPLFDNPLVESFNSFLKAIELNEKGKGKDKMTENLQMLKKAFIAEGSNSYSKKDFDNSFKLFSQAIEIGLNPLVASVDTALFFYTGLSAQLDNKLENAIEYYQKSIDYDYYAAGNVFTTSMMHTNHLIGQMMV